MKYYRLLPLFMLIALAGCSLKYEPKPSPVQPDKIPTLDITQPFALVNAQRSDAVINLPVSPYTVTVNLYKTTDTLIALIKDELNKKGVAVSESADKKIKISVVDIWMVPRVGVFKCDFNITADIGGNAIGMKASGESWNYEKAMDLALTETAIVFIYNDKFIQYVER